MKRIISLLLVLCFCVGLAACGKSASSSPAASAGDEAPAASAAPAAPAEATPASAPTPEPYNLQSLVDDLNAEEEAQRTEDDPSIGVFEVGTQENTIIYKFAMNIFQYVIMMAQTGDAENINAYNRLLDSLPGLENSLENALRESMPDLNIIVYLMVEETSDQVAAVVEDGEIVYDLVNGVGTAPTGVKPIFDVEIPPEIMAKIEEAQNEQAQNAG